MSDITDQTLSEIVSNIKNKKLSSKEVTNAFIERSEKSKKLNVYITENFTSAINQAKKFDENPNFELKLPHERLIDRNFVLHPLKEICPNCGNFQRWIPFKEGRKFMMECEFK